MSVMIPKRMKYNHEYEISEIPVSKYNSRDFLSARKIENNVRPSACTFTELNLTAFITP
jgi:hypothetical protein